MTKKMKRREKLGTKKREMQIRNESIRVASGEK